MRLNGSGNGRIYQTVASAECCNSPRLPVQLSITSHASGAQARGTRDPFQPLDLIIALPCMPNGPIDEK
jgi:hypothetical protein